MVKLTLSCYQNAITTAIGNDLCFTYVTCSIAGLWALVNNAGIDCLGDIEFCPMEFYRRVADVNLFGMVHVTKTFLPMIRKSKGIRST